MPMLPSRNPGPMGRQMDVGRRGFGRGGPGGFPTGGVPPNGVPAISNDLPPLTNPATTSRLDQPDSGLDQFGMTNFGPGSGGAPMLPQALPPQPAMKKGGKIKAVKKGDKAKAMKEGGTAKGWGKARGAKSCKIY